MVYLCVCKQLVRPIMTTLCCEDSKRKWIAVFAIEFLLIVMDDIDALIGLYLFLLLSMCTARKQYETEIKTAGCTFPEMNAQERFYIQCKQYLYNEKLDKLTSINKLGQLRSLGPFAGDYREKKRFLPLLTCPGCLVRNQIIKPFQSCCCFFFALIVYEIKFICI